MRSLHARTCTAVAGGAFLLMGCAATKGPPPSPVEPGEPIAKSSARSLVMRATACWMGGLWSDALGETGDARAAGIERRCTMLLRDVDITAGERERAQADHVPPPGPEEAYYPMRAVEPHVVDAIAAEVRARASKSPAESAEGPHLEALLRAVGVAAHETVRARRAADVVKNDALDRPVTEAYAADKAHAAAALQSRSGIDALFRVDAGPYAREARTFALLTALDRMEIARGLPKHLKLYAVGAAYSNVFGVAAPSVSPQADQPIASGMWLAYLTDVAAAARHPVPDDARDPQNREPLAWTGVLEGFADKLRGGGGRAADSSVLADIERGITSRLDAEYKGERQAYEAHAAKDR